ncbi:MAG: hypothetical protein M0008_08580 [Actinomycetota bacterium]|jgi:hypothetical protein|nr:hypothetical protein [Actinomycetota bacterium]
MAVLELKFEPTATQSVAVGQEMALSDDIAAGCLLTTVHDDVDPEAREGADRTKCGRTVAYAGTAMPAVLAATAMTPTASVAADIKPR